MILLVIYILGAVFAAVLGVACFIYKEKIVTLSDIWCCLIITFASWLSIVLWIICCLGDTIIYQKKANDMEAPEKIYIHVRANKELGTTWHGKKITNSDIEYTRTDAFIEKACEWIKEHTIEYAPELNCGVGKTQPDYYTKHFISDFIKYMNRL